MLTSILRFISASILCIILISSNKAFCSTYQEHQDDHHNHSDPPSEATFQGDIVDHSSEDHSGLDHDHAESHSTTHENDFYNDCGSPAVVHSDHHGFDPSATALHHIADANVYTIMDMIRIPLPIIIYRSGMGLQFFSSGRFHAGHHDNGHNGYKGYVLYEGNVHRIICDGFDDKEDFEVEGFDHAIKVNEEGKEIEKKYAIIDGKGYLLEQKTIWDGGMLGGGITSFYDLSPTKNVISMILVCLFLFVTFRAAANGYANREGKAPKGIQSLIETVFQFIRDDVAIPFLGEKHEKFLPLLMTIFFFILGLNLWGQVPLFGGVNVTGSLTITMVMAVIVFLVTNFNGNKHYWQHVLNMPGVPFFVKLILTPVEIMGLFIKPLTLMLRLAGNITAGHIAILSIVGLIFIFGNAGESLGGSVLGTAMAVPLTIFMMAIELVVAFVQAFVFTILTASYIGAATEEDHH